jgi:hypothetical protein
MHMADGMGSGTGKDAGGKGNNNFITNPEGSGGQKGGNNFVEKPEGTQEKGARPTNFADQQRGKGKSGANEAPSQYTPPGGKMPFGKVSDKSGSIGTTSDPGQRKPFNVSGSDGSPSPQPTSDMGDPDENSISNGIGGDLPADRLSDG